MLPIHSLRAWPSGTQPICGHDARFSLLLCACSCWILVGTVPGPVGLPAARTPVSLWTSGWCRRSCTLRPSLLTLFNLWSRVALTASLPRSTGQLVLIREVFELFDTDGEQQLDEEELASAIFAMGFSQHSHAEVCIALFHSPPPTLGGVYCEVLGAPI